VCQAAARTSLSPLPCSLASCCALATAFMRHDTPAEAGVGPEGPPDPAAASAAFRRASSRSAAGGVQERHGAHVRGQRCQGTEVGQGPSRAGQGTTKQGVCAWLGDVAAEHPSLWYSSNIQVFGTAVVGGLFPNMQCATLHSSGLFQAQAGHIMYGLMG
jgi:hypothetical protein